MGQEQRKSEPEDGRAKPGQQQQQPQPVEGTGVGADSALKQMKEWERRRASARSGKGPR
jgi:hypothetical protein